MSFSNLLFKNKQEKIQQTAKTVAYEEGFQNYECL